jgi:hypothetical protein
MQIVIWNLFVIWCLEFGIYKAGGSDFSGLNEQGGE